MSRALAVDPGEARLGLAVSDPGRMIARPLEVLPHTSRDDDARRIIDIARREGADVIVVGVAYDSQGDLGPAARRGVRLAEAIRRAGFPQVETFDESGTTQAALRLRRHDGMTDARAAAFLLQAYLDAAKTK